MGREPCPAPLHVAMRSPLPFPCVPDRPYKILLVQVGTLSFSHPSFVVFIYKLRKKNFRSAQRRARERAELAPFGPSGGGLRLGRLNLAEIDLFDDDGHLLCPL